MEEKGDKSKKPIKRLSEEQRGRSLAQSGLEELDVAEEVREGINSRSEAESDLEQRQRVKGKLVGATSEGEEFPKENS